MKYNRRSLIFGLRHYHKNMPCTFFIFVKEVGIRKAFMTWILACVKSLKKYVKDKRQIELMKVSEIEGAYDDISFEELLREDDRYNWSQLLLDIDKYGIHFPITICAFGYDCYKDKVIHLNGKKYACVAGNHRLKVMQVLDKGDSMIEIKIDDDPCNSEDL